MRVLPKVSFFGHLNILIIYLYYCHSSLHNADQLQYFGVVSRKNTIFIIARLELFISMRAQKLCFSLRFQQTKPIQ